MRPRRSFLLLPALLLMASTLSGATTAMSYESITVAASSIGFTRTTIIPTDGIEGNRPAQVCTGRLETAQIRFRYDGPAPTSSEGELLEVGERLTIRGTQNLLLFRGIRTGGTSGTLKMTCAR